MALIFIECSCSHAPMLCVILLAMLDPAGILLDKQRLLLTMCDPDGILRYKRYSTTISGSLGILRCKQRIRQYRIRWGPSGHYILLNTFLINPSTTLFGSFENCCFGR